MKKVSVDFSLDPQGVLYKKGKDNDKKFISLILCKPLQNYYNMKAILVQDTIAQLGYANFWRDNTIGRVSKLRMVVCEILLAM